MPSQRKFRLTAPIVPEEDIQIAVAQALDLLLMPPALWFALPIGHIKLPPQDAAKLSRIGLRTGLPDILVLHERCYGIELKRQGGVLSRTRMVRTRSGGLRMVEGQTDMFPKLVKAGCCIAVCRSVDEVLAALADWQVPLRVTVPAPPMRVTGGTA